MEDLPAGEQKAARTLVRRAAEMLSSDGTKRRDPLPGWTLVELDTQPGAAE